MSTSEPSSAFRFRPLTVTEWSRKSGRWIVSARLGEAWTLVGVFQHAVAAFRAADRAKERLTILHDRMH